jgi:hypothetical protein
MKTLKITAELIPEEEGYTVYCPELDITPRAIPWKRPWLT